LPKLPVEHSLLAEPVVFAGTLLLFALPVVHIKGANADNATASLSPVALPRKAPNHRLQSTNWFMLAVS